MKNMETTQHLTDKFISLSEMGSQRSRPFTADQNTVDLSINRSGGKRKLRYSMAFAIGRKVARKLGWQVGDYIDIRINVADKQILLAKVAGGTKGWKLGNPVGHSGRMRIQSVLQDELRLLWSSPTDASKPSFA